jgi:hypothetical protein
VGGSVVSVRDVAQVRDGFAVQQNIERPEPPCLVPSTAIIIRSGRARHVRPGTGRELARTRACIPVAAGEKPA